MWQVRENVLLSASNPEVLVRSPAPPITHTPYHAQEQRGVEQGGAGVIVWVGGWVGGHGEGIKRGWQKMAAAATAAAAAAGGSLWHTCMTPGGRAASRDCQSWGSLEGSCCHPGVPCTVSYSITAQSGAAVQ